jgi:hypothetical protein
LDKQVKSKKDEFFDRGYFDHPKYYWWSLEIIFTDEINGKYVQIL